MSIGSDNVSDGRFAPCESNDGRLFEIRHTECDGVAFRYVEPRQGWIVRAADAYYSDGTQPQTHTPIVCEHCGHYVEDVRFLRIGEQVSI